VLRFGGGLLLLAAGAVAGDVAELASDAARAVATWEREQDEPALRRLMTFIRDRERDDRIRLIERLRTLKPDVPKAVVWDPLAEVLADVNEPWPVRDAAAKILRYIREERPRAKEPVEEPGEEDAAVTAVRQFIDSFRSGPGRKEVELRLPKTLPKARPHDALEVESRVGYHVFRNELLRFVPGEEACAVERLTYTAALSPDLVWPGTEDEVEEQSGVRFECATMPRADYDRLCRELAAIRGASLVPRKYDLDAGRYGTSTASGYARLAFEKDGRAEAVSEGIVPVHPPGEGTVLRAIPDDLRRLLLWRRVVDRMDVVAFEPAGLAPILLDRLCRDIASAGQREAPRLRFRISVLGEAGYRPARKALAALAQRDDQWSDRVRVALAQIDVLNAEDRKAAVIEAAGHESRAVRDWAARRMRKDHPNEYRAFLEKNLDSRFPSTRERAYEQLLKMEENGRPLLERGLKDPSGRIRLACATRLWELAPDPSIAKVLLDVARDRTLTSRFDFSSRVVAAQIVGGLGPPVEPEPVRRALTRMLVDGKEDVLVRGGAAEGLGRLGSRKAIPVLREQFNKPPPDDAVYMGAGYDFGRHGYLQSDDMRGPIAEALAMLAAEEAVPDLAAFLLAEPRIGEQNLRPRVGAALAALGTPETARAALETERDRHERPSDREEWDRMIERLELLNARGGAKRLRASAHARQIPPACLAMHLARIATPKELTALKARFPKLEKPISAALARKNK